MKGILFFELGVVLFTVVFWATLYQKKYKHLVRKFIILFAGVFLFEVISNPMWVNSGFHRWSYLFHDVSWVLTLSLVDLFMLSFVLVDYSFKHIPLKRRFWLYILVVETFLITLESSLLASGIQMYADDLTKTMTGLKIPFTIVPIEAIYAIPLLAILIITFYKYINFMFEEKKHGRSARD